MIAGKEFPAGTDFASGTAAHKRRVVVSGEFSRDDEGTFSAPSGVFPVVWNKSSALASRTFLLGAVNQLFDLDEIYLIFDEHYYSSKISSGKNGSDSIRIFEEMIVSYQYLMAEILERLTKKHEKNQDRSSNPIKVVFVHKENVTKIDTVLSSKSFGNDPSLPMLSAASAAFKSFAENTAAQLTETKLFSPLLVQCEPGSDYSNRDTSLSSWLCDYLNSLDNLKSPLSVKDKLTWIKAGSKKPGSGFSLFR